MKDEKHCGEDDVIRPGGTRTSIKEEDLQAGNGDPHALFAQAGLDAARFEIDVVRAAIEPPNNRQMPRFSVQETSVEIGAAGIRQALATRGVTARIPSKSNRKQPIEHDREFYRQRHKIENMFSRLKDWRRIHARYDRCAHTFMSAICIATATFRSPFAGAIAGCMA